MFLYEIFFFLTANTQNICNLIDREEQNNGCIKLLISILYSMLKNNETRFVWPKGIQIYYPNEK